MPLIKVTIPGCLVRICLRLDTYPASEGFIGFQYSPADAALLLNTQGGIFFEFVTQDELLKDHPQRLKLAEVQPGVTYAILLSTNAGMWAYNIGDTIEFVSLDPYLFIINGRISQYISAFGEHVIEKEVESALLQTCEKHLCSVNEAFTVAPQVRPQDGGKPYHQWFIDFEHHPQNLTTFVSHIMTPPCASKILYYDDLIVGHILQPIQLNVMRSLAFRILREVGLFGGQNKIPHLRNDPETG